jgi:UDP-N-acetylmuramate: L-alanyl-gamma-D-glutamyl-meso-diaminopimelate ligase
MAATAAALTLHPDDPTKLDLSPLAKFRGVRRRQQIHIQRDDLVVIEDFGHHPSAIRETILSFRARFPGYAITVAFEPRSNTARTNVLQDKFQSALAEADTVLIGPIDRADRLSEAERFDTAAVTEAIRKLGKSAIACASNEEVFTQLTGPSASAADKPRLIAFFTNGSFGGLIARTREALQ